MLCGNGLVPAERAEEDALIRCCKSSVHASACSCFITLVLIPIDSHSMLYCLVHACCHGWRKWGGTTVKPYSKSLCHKTMDYSRRWCSRICRFSTIWYPILSCSPGDGCPLGRGQSGFESRSPYPLRSLGSSFLFAESTRTLCA